MLLEYSSDEQAIHEAFAGLFASQCPAEVVRDAEPLGFASPLWQSLAETGAVGMPLPLAAGGGGSRLAEVGIVAHLMGAHLAPVPLIEHIVAARLIASLQYSPNGLSELAGNSPAHSPPTMGLLESLAAGDTIATLALRPAASDPAIAQLLPAGAVADVFLTLVTGAELELLATHSPAPFVALPNTASLPLADRIIYPEDPTGNVSLLAAGERAANSFARALSEWKALTAMALCGLGQRAVEIGVDYALEREQFQRPIGSFQAVQHGLADSTVELEAAHYLTQRALWLLDTASPQADAEAAMAFLFASQAAQHATAAALQYHGGYGYAEEYDIGLYHRRAKGWSLLYDDPANEYQRLAKVLL